MKLQERLSTSVDGLDDVLQGGLIRGATYILQGSAGAGKTILANQIAFAEARRTRNVLYVTLLAESHERLFQSLASFSFFDESLIGTRIIFLSLFKVLREEGLPALVSAIQQELSKHRCSVLVLDGLLVARDGAHTDLNIKTLAPGRCGDCE